MCRARKRIEGSFARVIGLRCRLAIVALALVSGSPAAAQVGGGFSAASDHIVIFFCGSATPAQCGAVADTWRGTPALREIGADVVSFNPTGFFNVPKLRQRRYQESDVDRQRQVIRSIARANPNAKISIVVSSLGYVPFARIYPELQVLGIRHVDSVIFTQVSARGDEILPKGAPHTFSFDDVALKPRAVVVLKPTKKTTEFVFDEPAIEFSGPRIERRIPVWKIDTDADGVETGPAYVVGAGAEHGEGVGFAEWWIPDLIGEIAEFQGSGPALERAAASAIDIPLRRQEKIIATIREQNPRNRKAWKKGEAGYEEMIQRRKEIEAQKHAERKQGGNQRSKSDTAKLPSYWTEAGTKPWGQTRTEAVVITGLVPTARKVVVFGESTAADLTYEKMAERIGEENVLREYRVPDAETQQKIAHRFGADAILGVRGVGREEGRGDRRKGGGAAAGSRKTAGAAESGESGDAPGGVSIDPRLEVEVGDLRERRREVSETRPGADSLTWPAPK